MSRRYRKLIEKWQGEESDQDTNEREVYKMEDLSKLSDDELIALKREYESKAAEYGTKQLSQKIL